MSNHKCMKHTKIVSPKGAAEILGLSTDHIRRMDPILRPERDHLGHRIYRRDAVEKFAERRASARGAK